MLTHWLVDGVTRGGRAVHKLFFSQWIHPWASAEIMQGEYKYGCNCTRLRQGRCCSAWTELSRNSQSYRILRTNSVYKLQENLRTFINTGWLGNIAQTSISVKMKVHSWSRSWDSHLTWYFNTNFNYNVRVCRYFSGCYQNYLHTSCSLVFCSLFNDAVATRLRTRWPRNRGSIFGRDKKPSRPALGSTHPPIQWVPGVKQQGPVADHSTPSSAKIKNGGAIIPFALTP
jgi:hypothetical protein